MAGKKKASAKPRHIPRPARKPCRELYKSRLRYGGAIIAAERFSSDARVKGEGLNAIAPDKLLNSIADFQRIFHHSLFFYMVKVPPGAFFIEFPRLFKDLGVPSDETSIEVMRRKYGQEAVDLVARLL